MTPEQISLLTATAAIVERIGTWPIGSIIALVVLCPWLTVLVISRAMDKRVTAALTMYESNVRLVEKYEKIADEQVDTIRMSTAGTVELVTFLRERVPCFERMRDGVRIGGGSPR